MTSKPDKLYRVWDCKLELATFVSEQIVDGATLPNWAVRYPNGHGALTSPEHWELTELAAWEKYYQELSRSGTHLIRALKDAQSALTECTEQLNVAAQKIAGLRA